MFILMPLSRGTRLVKIPWCSLVLIILTTFVYLQTWPDQKKYYEARVPNTPLHTQAKELARLALASDSPALKDVKLLIQKENERLSFPTRKAHELFEQITKQALGDVSYWMDDASATPEPELPDLRTMGENIKTMEEASEFLMRFMGAQKRADDRTLSWDSRWRQAYIKYTNLLKKLEQEGVTRNPPFDKWAFDPERGFWPGIFTHMFLHSGFLHLLFNMFFLWLAGSSLEERWGSPLFLLIYFSGGIAAAFIQEIAQSVAGIGCVGASGAVAALMGAFLIRHYKMPIRMFYLIFFLFFIRTGTFHAPAWTMLVLWLGEQLVNAMITSNAAHVGVAYWAHIGGFVFGSGVGFFINRFKLAKTWEKEAEATEGGTELKLDEAEKLFQEGKALDAKKTFEELYSHSPNNLNVVLGLIKAKEYVGEDEHLMGLRLRALSLCLKEAKIEYASKLLADWKLEIKVEKLSDKNILLFGQILTDTENFNEAAQAYNFLVKNRASSSLRGKAIFLTAKLLKDRLKKPDLAYRWLQVLVNKPYDMEWGDIARAELAKYQKKAS